MHRRLLLAAGGGSSFPVPYTNTLYALFNGGYDGTLYQIGAATSTDAGVTWSVYGSNPVLTPGAGGAWDDVNVKDPQLVWDGSQYVMYFAGYDGTDYRIGRATAPAHTGPWTKYAGNPVVGLGTAGAFDDDVVAYPTILHEPADTGREWKMWYSGVKVGGQQSVGYAYSADGLSWTKVGQVLDIGASGAWDDVGIGPTGIVKSGGTYHLFIGGRQGTTNPRWQGGVATFTDPEGAYTKDAGNPTVLAGFNTGEGTSLTGTTAAGGTVVTCASTAWCHVGQAVVLVDGDSETEVHAIASIDSGTQVTLAYATASAFTAGAGGVLRSITYNCSYVRSVLPRDGGSWIAFGGGFQPVEDLSPGGTKLRESSLRYTGPSLTGTWAIDYSTAGVLFPMYPANTGWDKYSAENPSVIPAP